ncbi:MAG: DUF3987 domain-containing protein [Pseudonocardia sp.]
MTALLDDMRAGAKAHDSAKEVIDNQAPGLKASAEDGETLSVVPFPVLDSSALVGLPGRIIRGVAPYTEAHPAAMLVQLLARFGIEVGDGPHLVIGNRQHAARLNPLIVGKTSDGAKGTGHEVVTALFSVPGTGALVAELDGPGPVRVLSGLSSGEGLIELVRDESGSPCDKSHDPGVDDKRLLVVEPEFAGVLAVMERNGTILPRVLREAWDGDTLRTLSRHSPLSATGAHISIVGHVTPGELKIKLSEAQMVGGTLNRFLPVASRRTQLRADGGNIPAAVLAEFGTDLADAVAAARKVRTVSRAPGAERVWSAGYAELRRSRPDGPVAQMLARAAPQVMRIALAYALVDGHNEITEDHLTAALALWRYVEATAEWIFGARADPAEIQELAEFITAAGKAGRTRTEISNDHYRKNKPGTQIKELLSELVNDGRVREVIDRGKPGRPPTRYVAATD